MNNLTHGLYLCYGVGMSRERGEGCGYQLREVRPKTSAPKPGSFYAARRIESDRRVQGVTKRFAMELGRSGIIKTARSLHVTVGDGAVIGELQRQGYTAEDIRDYARRLNGMLKHNFGVGTAGYSGNAMFLDIDPDRPFGWYGRGARNKIALNLLLEGSLEEQIQAIAEYHQQHIQFESSTGFEPHISFGKVADPTIRDDLLLDVDRIMQGAKQPKKVKAEPPEAFVGRISSVGDKVWRVERKKKKKGHRPLAA